ncbi:uncharacterized protein METZ01_LOCUS432995 [marine metagenome]|uniref:Uncharacterized protein n=1 Tax=marine metagenome TaxID=408172 RepID=A0A382YBA6_9ZZZZ
MAAALFRSRAALGMSVQKVPGPA